MIASLVKRLKGELALALICTFLARGIAAVGGIVLFVVLGRLYGAEGVGVFALAQSVFIGAGIFGRYGMDNALMRYVGQDPTSQAVSIYLRWALAKSAYLSTAAAVFVFLLRHRLALWFDAPMLSGLLSGIAVAIPPFTAAFVLAGFMKGVRKPVTASMLENGSISLVAAFLLVLFQGNSDARISIAGWSMAAAAWLVFAQGLVQANHYLRSISDVVCEKVVCMDEFIGSTRALFVASLAPLLQQTFFVIIAGFFLSDSDLGLFKVAERTGLLVGFILIVINAVLPPRFAALYAQGKIRELVLLARNGAFCGAILASPLLVLCVFFPDLVLGCYGDDFTEAAFCLQIISLAQMFNVATGSISYLLCMTGGESVLRNILLFSNIIGVSLLLCSVSSGGYVSCAVSLASIIVIQNTLSLYFSCKRLIGFYRYS